LGAYPLFDQTGARYAEIARLMAETHDWIVPHIDYGVPFWAKPPLSTWLSAISIGIFGTNEFAVRLPSFVLAVATVSLTYLAIPSHRFTNLISATVLASSALFFISAGAVMTDMSLTFCSTLAMFSFYRAVELQKRSWSHMFFVALGLGMLAKGPIVIVIVGLATGTWTLWTGRWRDVWNRLPWFWGPTLATAISLPWYIAAEIRSPGFLYYFFIVEHFDRFLATRGIPDLYGHQSIHFYGMIWVFWFLAVLTWPIFFFGKIWQKSKSEPLTSLSLSDQQRYFLCWALAPVVFFTFTRDVLWTYVLPGLPASAILIADLALREWDRSNGLRQWPKAFVASALLVPILMIGFGDAYALGFVAPSSGKALRSQLDRLEPWTPGRLAYLGHRPYSGQFYELGRAPLIAEKDIARVIKSGHIKYLAIPRNSKSLSEVDSRLKLVGGDHSYQLFRIDNSRTVGTN
jgi:4-amino-4-deoxy-L-arabinose transferase-like glycosyltransferase